MRNQHYNSSEKPGARAKNLPPGRGVRTFVFAAGTQASGCSHTGEEARAYIGGASSAAGNHWMVTSGGFLSAAVAI
jgi:hypothetical protein